MHAVLRSFASDCSFVPVYSAVSVCAMPDWLRPSALFSFSCVRLYTFVCAVSVRVRSSSDCIAFYCSPCKRNVNNQEYPINIQKMR